MTSPFPNVRTVCSGYGKSFFVSGSSRAYGASPVFNSLASSMKMLFFRLVVLLLMHLLDD